MSSARIMLLLVFLSLFPFAGLAGQNQGDIEAIHQLLDRYTELDEAMDMAAQAQLMSEDRVWIGAFGGRRTDQAKNMRVQQAQFDVLKEAIPDIEWFVDDTDRLLRFYGNGDVAVASFFRYPTYIVPAGAPPEIAEPLSVPIGLAITAVLEKSGGEWKIVHTHISNLYPPSEG